MIFDDDAPDASEETTTEAADETVDEVAEEATDEAADEPVDEAAGESTDEAVDETPDDSEDAEATDGADDEAAAEEASDDAAEEDSAKDTTAEEDGEEAADTSEDESAESADADGEESGGDDDGDAELTLGEGTDEPEEPREPRMPTLIRGKIDRHGVAIGTGRRKTAVARVRIQDGDGQMTINGRALDNYFQIERDRLLIEAPLRATEMLGSVDVWVRVNGGGPTGQAGAIVLGIARALQAKKPLLHETLSDGGYLTRDGRMVERKKYGYKKARKSFQFSKR